MLYFYVLLYCVIILLCYECICMCNMYRRVNFSQLYFYLYCFIMLFYVIVCILLHRRLNK